MWEGGYVDGYRGSEGQFETFAGVATGEGIGVGLEDSGYAGEHVNYGAFGYGFGSVTTMQRW